MKALSAGNIEDIFWTMVDTNFFLVNYTFVNFDGAMNIF
jgi:hypothetical protein